MSNDPSRISDVLYRVLRDTPKYRIEVLRVMATGGASAEVPPSIVCKTCNLRSWNRNDVEQRYCGHCHVFHEDPTRQPPPVPPPQG